MEKYDNDNKSYSATDEIGAIKARILELQKMLAYKEESHALEIENLKKLYEQQEEKIIAECRYANHLTDVNLRRTQRENKELLAENTSNKIIISQLENEIKDKNFYEQRVKDLESSTSWRLTEPIRLFKDFLGKSRSESDNSKKTELHDGENEWFDKNHVKADDIGERNNSSYTESNGLLKKQARKSKVDYVPESVCGAREPVDELAEKLARYDVISFDIFDTLVLRLFSNPTTLFKIIGSDIGMDNFERLRIGAEKEARELHTDKNGEINIHDIYELLHKYCGIDVETGIKRELEFEKAACYANPYMADVYHRLIELNKKVIIISDMYIPESMMEELLHSCGYSGWTKLYVSNEYHVGKGRGKLQSIAAKDFPGDTSFIHIGDNEGSDVKGSEETGWDAYYYESCEKRGDAFRPADMLSVTGSIYKGLVNAKLYNGIKQYNEYYEHGYIYGGPIVCGYCDWINQYAKQRDIDKILFLARDMDVISKAYSKYYRKYDTEYAVISRLAVFKLVFSIQTEEYIENYIHSQAKNATSSIAICLYESGLSFLTELLEADGIDTEKLFTEEEYPVIKSFIYQHKELIEERFRNSLEAGIAYWKEIIGNAKRICLADLGWSGTILLYMRQFINTYIGSDIVVTGANIAANSNAQTTELIESGLLDAYLFHGKKNRDMMLSTDQIEGNTSAALMEEMFTSGEQSLIEYCMKENGEIGFRYDDVTESKVQIEEIQKGIIDFAEDYAVKAAVFTEKLQFSSVDAFAPFNDIRYDFYYQDKIFGRNMVHKGVTKYNGGGGIGDVVTLHELMHERNLI